jgi:hypothetical protein
MCPRATARVLSASERARGRVVLTSTEWRAAIRKIKTTLPLDRALTIFANQSATELTSSIVADIIPAAFYGRLSHLFVQKGQHIWGRFEKDTAELKLHGERRENSKDLLDLAVIQTLTTGGEVYLLDQQQMPAQSQLAAVFRY